MTGTWLLANDLKQISDCTGGHKVMQFDTASQNKIQGTKAMRKFANFIYKVNLNVARHYIKNHFERWRVIIRGSHKTKRFNNLIILPHF